MTGCSTCVKYLLFIFNFALWLFGCALLSVGIWLRTDDTANHHVQDLTETVDSEYRISYSAIGDIDVTSTISVLLILFGLVIIVVAFIGCCGAVRENTCLLGVFAICLLVLTIALVSIGVWASVKRNDVGAHTEALKEKTYADVEKAVDRYYKDEASREFMDKVQHRFKCCGASNSNKDYPRKSIPSSCLPEYYRRRCTTRYFNYVGNEIEEFLKGRYLVIATIALVFGACMAGGLALTLLMYCFVKRSSTVIVS